MDSEEEFFGTGSIKVSKPRKFSKNSSRDRFFGSEHTSEQTAQESAEESDEDESETHVDDVSNFEKEKDDTETDVDSEDEKNTEDDPLSDVWDSADEDEESLGSRSEKEDPSDPEETFTEHEFVIVKTRSGQKKKVDLTPPDTQLSEAGKLRQKFYRQKKPDECLTEAVRCLAFSKIVYGHEAPWKLADCHAWIAKAYWELKEYAAQTHMHAEEAKKYLLKTETASNLTLKHAPPEKTDLLDTILLTYYLLGKGLLGLKRVSEAEQNFQKAEKVLTERKNAGKMKDKQFWATEINTALARVKICQHNPEKAFEYLEKVRKNIEKRYGQESEKIVSILHEMAKLKQSSGTEADFEEAVELCLQAYSISKTKNDDASDALAESAKTLALSYAKLSSEEADIYAESYFNESIGCFQLVHGNLNSKTLKTQELLAKHLAAKKRPQEAISVFSPTLPNYCETFGEFSSKTAGAYKTLASFCLQTGNTVEAATYLKKAVETESELFGPTHAKTKATKKALDVLLKNPSAKHLKGESKFEDRPRFQSIVKIPAIIGGFKRALPDY